MSQEKRSTKTEVITRPQRLQIAGESFCDERSVAAVYNGNPVRSATRARVIAAAKRLGLPAPADTPTK